MTERIPLLSRKEDRLGLASIELLLSERAEKRDEDVDLSLPLKVIP